MSTILTDGSDKDVLRRFYQMADKPERMRAFALLDRYRSFGEKTFWTNFWEIWQSSESLYRDGEVIAYLVLGRSTVQARDHLEDDEIAAVQGLGAETVIYRGCSSGNEEGWSWTLDRAVAVRFANRAHDGIPIILTGMVAEKDVLGILLGRNEHEVICPPDSVTITAREVLPEVSRETRAHMGFFQMVHEGRLDEMFAEAGEDEFRAKMMADHLLATKSVAEALAFVQPNLDFCEALGLRQISRWRTLKALVEERQAA